MKPVDYRNENWFTIRNRLEGFRQLVYSALLQQGPCTSRELSERSELDILSVRPRLTELGELGLAECVGGANGEGIYRAISLADAGETWLKRRRESRTGQMELL